MGKLKEAKETKSIPENSFLEQKYQEVQDRIHAGKKAEVSALGSEISKELRMDELQKLSPAEAGKECGRLKAEEKEHNQEAENCREKINALKAEMTKESTDAEKKADISKQLEDLLTKETKEKKEAERCAAEAELAFHRSFFGAGREISFTGESLRSEMNYWSAEKEKHETRAKECKDEVKRLKEELKQLRKEIVKEAMDELQKGEKVEVIQKKIEQLEGEVYEEKQSAKKCHREWVSCERLYAWIES